MIEPIVQLCVDCAHNRMAKYDPELTDNYDPETGAGFHEFSKTPCYACGDILHGYRYDFTCWTTTKEN